MKEPPLDIGRGQPHGLCSVQILCALSECENGEQWESVLAARKQEEKESSKGHWPGAAGLREGQPVCLPGDLQKQPEDHLI